MGNLWIGPPGALYEIDRAAKSFERAADLGVSEFKALSGRITLSRTAPPVRRVKLSWDMLEPQTARVLDRLARRVDGGGNGVGPLVLIDPAAGNVLEPAQATGRGPAGASGLAQWFRVSATGAVTETTPGVFAFTAADATGQVAWRCVPWSGNFPAAAGLRVSFRAPSAFAALGTVSVGIDFKKADGSYLSTVSATGPFVAATVPAGATHLTPTAKTGTAGTYSLAGACLTYGGDGAADDVPGDGLPKLAVTGYSDTPGRPLPYRNVGVDLVEVTGATG
ncbi:hypothetical protein [Streptomyces sp. Ag109_G2-15]|uniref:hypothetical protein n=1 Tax=Streptomyces sp. Ag109_G2-15 TaxID=1938850 RepID=UPI000BCD38A8|nr:hypothetical protein [Streptomyces sp. Ag109_G2-15]SOD84973.1 hypothetical protein SAMN06272765_2369 [Streptomyces sp. Ag109_G2-15]